jgi:hypothetical protein
VIDSRDPFAGLFDALNKMAGVEPAKAKVKPKVRVNFDVTRLSAADKEEFARLIKVVKITVENV